MTSTTQETDFANRFALATGRIYTGIYMIAAAWVGIQIWIYSAGWYLTATHQLGPQWQQAVTSYCLKQVKGCRAVAFDINYFESTGWSSGGFSAVKRRVVLTMDLGMQGHVAILAFIEPAYRDHVVVNVRSSKGEKK